MQQFQSGWTLIGSVRCRHALGEEKERERPNRRPRPPGCWVGILLSGIPEELASFPLGLGWIFPILGAGFAVAGIVHLGRGWTS
jgi:hypothetical protein